MRPNFEDPFGAAGFEDCFDWSCFEDGFCASWFIAGLLVRSAGSSPCHLDPMGFVALGAGQSQNDHPTLEFGGALVGVDREGERDRACERAVHPFMPYPHGAFLRGLLGARSAYGDGIVPNCDIERSGEISGTSAARIAPSGLVHRFNIGNSGAV